MRKKCEHGFFHITNAKKLSNHESKTSDLITVLCFPCQVIVMNARKVLSIPDSYVHQFSSLFRKAHFEGSITCPTKRIIPDSLSLIKNMKGLSHVNLVGGSSSSQSDTHAAVAAAASVPSSLTSTKAFCTTWYTLRSLLLPVIPENNQNSYGNSSPKYSGTVVKFPV